MFRESDPGRGAAHVSDGCSLRSRRFGSPAGAVAHRRSRGLGFDVLSRFPRLVLAAVLACVLVSGTGVPARQAWANGFNFPDGSYLYANRDSSTRVQRYVDIDLKPCDKNFNTNKSSADRQTFGQYYLVQYQFNNHNYWWGARPFWWGGIPKNTQLVGDQISLIKYEELTHKHTGPQTVEKSTGYSKEKWVQSNSRFWFTNDGNDANASKNFAWNWQRMTGEAGHYNQSGNTLETSRAYGRATHDLIINWERRGNTRFTISFKVQVIDKNIPLKFAAGVYQVAGNWHYTAGKTVLAPTLATYAQELELNYPKEKVPVAKFGNPSEPERQEVLKRLWEANQNNTDVLKHLKGMPQNPTRDGFDHAVSINQDGSATVTYADNSSGHKSVDTIVKENLTRRYVPLANRTQITYPPATTVKNPEKLTPAERQQVAQAVKDANQNVKNDNKQNGIKKVEVDEKGNATVTFNDTVGTPSTKKLEGKYLVRKQVPLAEQFTPYYPSLPLPVDKVEKLTPQEKTQLIGRIFDANKDRKDGFMDAIGNPTDAGNAENRGIIKIGYDGSATIVYRDNAPDFPSRDKLDDKAKLVVARGNLAERTKLAYPVRTPVNDPSKLSVADIAKVKQAVWAANVKKSGDEKVFQKADGTTAATADSAFTFDNGSQQMTVHFADGSTTTVGYDLLVYAQPKAKPPVTEQSGTESGDYEYNLTKIAIPDVDNPTEEDWNKFVRRFIQDNWQAKPGQTPITDDFINKTPGLLGKFTSFGFPSGMQLKDFYDKWDVKDGSSLDLSDNRLNPGVLSVYLDIPSGEVGRARVDVYVLTENKMPNLAFALDSSKCFVLDTAGTLKKQAEELIRNALRRYDLPDTAENKNDEDIDKYVEAHKQDINKVKNPSDMDKLVQQADQYGKKIKQDGEKAEEEAKQRQQSENANNTARQEQQEANTKQQEADKKAEQDTKQQQQEDNQAVTEQKTKQDQQQKADDKKGKEQEQNSQLESEKQKVIDKIMNNDKLKPEDKQKFIKQVQDTNPSGGGSTGSTTGDSTGGTGGGDTSGGTTPGGTSPDTLDNIRNILKQAEDQGTTNQQTADTDNYGPGGTGTGSSTDQAKQQAEQEEKQAKNEAKTKIDDLQNHGQLTPDEAQKFKDRIEHATGLPEVNGILTDAELAQNRNRAKDDIDKLQYLNNAQKKTLQQEVDTLDGAVGPQDDTIDVAKFKEAINKVVEKAKALDGKMKDLHDLIGRVNAQKGKLTQTPDYLNNTDKKRDKFDQALRDATKLDDKDTGQNADSAEVENYTKALQDAADALGGVDKPKVDKAELLDKTKLQQLVDEAPTVEKTPKYVNSDSGKQDAYTRAIAEGKKVLQNPQATKPDVDKAIQAINQAKNGLNGADSTPSPTSTPDSSPSPETNPATPPSPNSTPSPEADSGSWVSPDFSSDSGENPTPDSSPSPDSQMKTTSSDPLPVDKRDLLSQIAKAEADPRNHGTGKSDGTRAGVNSDDAMKTAFASSPALQGNGLRAKGLADFDAALVEAKKVAADPDATQSQVDDATRNLANARQSLGDAQSEGELAHADTPLKVDNPGREAAEVLSKTGCNASLLALLAEVMVTVGTVLFWGTRRRRNPRHSM
ncbi:GA module-containing protein [Mobiluncus mulieris]|uniref:GA module-containing protein n=1 Tax=Mobiluncus mulieris TaxID=2052 RepID=UPI001BAC3EF5|nr:GA module-containing protein [Mobiluncus mulieris]